MDADAKVLNYGASGLFRRRKRFSVYLVAAVLLSSAAAAVIEFLPTFAPTATLLHGDARAIPSLLVWLSAIVYIAQRAREDRHWPCGGLVLMAGAGAISCTLFTLQCVLWREQLKYGDKSDRWSILPLTVALAAFGVAAIGRRLTHRCSGPSRPV